MLQEKDREAEAKIKDQTDSSVVNIGPSHAYVDL